MLGLLALAIIASPIANAQTSGWYVGANIGNAKASIDDARITSGLLGSGFTATSITDNDSDTGYKVFGGYQFNRHFALEGGYFDLGQFGFTAGTLPGGTLNGVMKLSGVNLDAVLLVPFTDKFSGFARLGATSAQADNSFTSTGLVNVLTPAPHKRSINPKAGLGIQYQFNSVLGMRAEVERYRINDGVYNRGDLDLASVGLVLRFGKHRSEPAPAAAPTPMPTPVSVAVVEVVPAKTQIYCSILDIQFQIDEGEIQREDREKLAVVGVFLTKYPETTAVIEGHADSVGSHEHNQKLSQERADSVVTYLTKTYAIAPARLKAVGYGETRPIADNNSEEGKRLNRRIDAVIACATDIEGLKVMPARITMAMLIEFDPNKAEVKAEYGDELRKVARYMKANPKVNATVEGHTGNLQATPQEAMAISQERAKNVVTFLVDKCGIDRSRLTAEGFGKSRPVAYNATAEGQQENRRVNIIFTYPK